MSMTNPPPHRCGQSGLSPAYGQVSYLWAEHPHPSLPVWGKAGVAVISRQLGYEIVFLPEKYVFAGNIVLI